MSNAKRTLAYAAWGVACGAGRVGLEWGSSELAMSIYLYFALLCVISVLLPIVTYPIGIVAHVVGAVLDGVIEPRLTIALMLGITAGVLGVFQAWCTVTFLRTFVKPTWVRVRARRVVPRERAL